MLMLVAIAPVTNYWGGQDGSFNAVTSGLHYFGAIPFFLLSPLLELITTIRDELTVTADTAWNQRNARMAPADAPSKRASWFQPHYRQSLGADNYTVANAIIRKTLLRYALFNFGLRFIGLLLLNSDRPWTGLLARKNACLILCGCAWARS